MRATIARDYFVKALSPEMQIALKSIPDFADKNIQQLVTETTRLKLAGIKCRENSGATISVLFISEKNQLVKDITENVVSNIKSLSLGDPGMKAVDEDASVKYVHDSGRTNDNNYYIIIIIIIYIYIIIIIDNNYNYNYNNRGRKGTGHNRSRFHSRGSTRPVWQGNENTVNLQCR